jgi:hypothetical protein
VANIANYKPSPAELNAEGNSLYIAFVAVLGDASKQKLLSFITEVGEFHVKGI